MMITGSWTAQLDRLEKFRWSKGGFRYLGVILTPISSKLYSANYDKLISQVKNDLERWEMLPLSLVGRVETIRMNVLPRLLFLFCSLPIVVPVPTFKLLDRLVSWFIWQNKRPRVRLKVLCLLKENSLRVLVSWMRLDMDTKWVHIEQSSVNTTLSALPFLTTNALRKLRIQN